MKISLLLFVILINSSEQWLSIIQVSDISFATQGLCHMKYGLSYRQIRFCQRNEAIMPFVRFGANLALEECKLQFKNRHWNCTLFQDKSLVGNILDSGTKESAYIHALTSAGIAYTITKACSTGRLSSCGCDMSMKEKTSNSSIRWAGCSDNVLFGSELARKFVNLRERITKNRTSLLNVHNNQVGIRTILASVDRQCKCHGVSGSCEFKTCWRSLHSFTQIAKQLKEYYDESIEVRLQRSLFDKKLRFIPRNIPYHMTKQTTTTATTYKNDLIYYNSSPNFCEINLNAGSFGTTGRVCNRSSRAIDGCDLLCCNRGYQSQIVTVRDKCNCRFQWCCYVQCQNCVTTQEISRCL
ncbi:unnamed protein product [Adineta steineri]|uniref:Protein Wnt n=1 Tax=Adineta steineri TaxID=433720 RepID=A0A819F8H7_9BILA|nr:unnamed protein product [Adineta steineri]CAF3864274.1 unnamed protein product [Adineta steineri]